MPLSTAAPGCHPVDPFHNRGHVPKALDATVMMKEHTGSWLSQTRYLTGQPYGGQAAYWSHSTDKARLELGSEKWSTFTQAVRYPRVIQPERNGKKAGLILEVPRFCHVEFEVNENNNILLRNMLGSAVTAHWQGSDTARYSCSSCVPPFMSQKYCAHFITHILSYTMIKYFD